MRSQSRLWGEGDGAVGGLRVAQRGVRMQLRKAGFKEKAILRQSLLGGVDGAVDGGVDVGDDAADLR